MLADPTPTEIRQDRRKLDAPEHRFGSQWPSVAIAVAAIGLIVAVNVRAPAPTARPAPTHEVETPATRIAHAAGPDLAPVSSGRG